MFLNQGTVTVEGLTQMINDLRNSESKKGIWNHTLIHATLIISVMSATVRNQIRASDVDRMIISSQIFQNHTLQIRKFTVTRKSLKIVRTDRQK